MNDRKSVDVGQKFVNNDACYPAIISIGQMVEAFQSGKYDVNNTAVMMTQTGGGCRATNYIPLIRKALKDAGFGQVPVVSLSLGNQGVEETSGFKMTLPFAVELPLPSYTVICSKRWFTGLGHTKPNLVKSIRCMKIG